VRPGAPRRSIFLVAAGICAAACNLITGLSSLEETAAEGRDGGSDANAPREGGDTATTTRDAGEAAAPRDARSDGPCDAQLSSDPQNCGACGKSCGVEDCLDASCAPHVVLSGVDVSGRIVVDSKHVYFFGDGGIGSVPVTGGSARSIVSGIANLNYIAVDSENVYFSVELSVGTAPVERAPLAGGPITVLAPNRDGANQVAVQGDVLYWAEQGDGSDNGAVMGVSTDGGTPFIISAPQIGPEELVVDSENAYFTNWDNSGKTVVQVSLFTRMPEPLATAVFHPISIAIDSSNVYFADVPYADNGDSGTVDQVPKGGGTVITLASSLFASVVASDGVNVYWTDRDQGTLQKVPVGGGPVVPMLSNLGPTFGMALDDVSVFCVDLTGKSILRVNK
jgi:hypothetical protein